jgi:nucleoside-diphosphate-sugar epimerase
MKRVILTGATGFVGANLARRLLQEGHELHLLVRPEHESWRIATLPAEVRLHQVALADGEGLKGRVGQIKPDWVFHLATHGAYAWQTERQTIMQTNLIGTINLVEACLACGFEAFVNTGSASEYGFKDHPPPETEWLEPNSDYAVSKAAATMFCRYIAQRHRVHLPTLRLYSVFGPYEAPGRLIPSLILNGLQGKLPPLVHPDVARDYIYVDEVTEAYLLAATTPGQAGGAIYNVGSGVQTTLRQVVEIGREVLGLTVEPAWGSMPKRSWDTEVWQADNRAIKQALGWQPRLTFAAAFRQTVAWFQDPAIRQFYLQSRPDQP